MFLLPQSKTTFCYTTCNFILCNKRVKKVISLDKAVHKTALFSPLIYAISVLELCVIFPLSDWKIVYKHLDI